MKIKEKYVIISGIIILLILGIFLFSGLFAFLIPSANLYQIIGQPPGTEQYGSGCMIGGGDNSPMKIGDITISPTYGLLRMEVACPGHWAGMWGYGFIDFDINGVKYRLGMPQIYSGKRFCACSIGTICPPEPYPAGGYDYPGSPSPFNVLSIQYIDLFNITTGEVRVYNMAAQAGAGEPRFTCTKVNYIINAKKFNITIDAPEETIINKTEKIKINIRNDFTGNLKGIIKLDWNIGFLSESNSYNVNLNYGSNAFEYDMPTSTEGTLNIKATLSLALENKDTKLTDKKIIIPIVDTEGSTRIGKPIIEVIAPGMLITLLPIMFVGMLVFLWYKFGRR